MKTGRIPSEEQVRRLRLLLGFIFNFRYATRKQLDMFVQLIMNLSYTRWLIEDSHRKGYISAYKDYYEPSCKTKIYYLTQKGKEFIREQECLSENYHFEKRHAGTNTFPHHNALVYAYFLLKGHLNIKEWACEWVLRIGKHKREKIPDALMILQDGTKITLEVETSYKTASCWKTVIELYRYDIYKVSRYHGVLIVASNRTKYEGIKTMLFKLDPVFCAERFILSELGMLEQGKCLYKDKIIHLEEAFKLIREVS